MNQAVQRRRRLRLREIDSIGAGIGGDSIALVVVQPTIRVLPQSLELIEIYAQVVKEDDSAGTKLIDLSIRLDNFKSPPEPEISELHKHFKDNTFALAVLRDLVANYLYLMPVEESTRQRLTEAFEIRITPKMLIGRDKKLLRT